MNSSPQSESANYSPTSLGASLSGFWIWLVVLIVSAVLIWLAPNAAWLAKPPVDWVLPIADYTNQFMQVLVNVAKPMFRLIGEWFAIPMEALQGILQWLPWPATIAIFAAFAWVAAGWKLSLFTVLALMYMVITGYWSPSMNTLGTVLVSIPLALLLGFGLAVITYDSPKVNRVVQPLLDFMQTVPTFAYLIPIMLLFGFGPVVGVVASAIYACPPMVRNMIVGLQQVSPDVLESGRMSGATPMQLFWQVRIPNAMSTIMVGINQATMAALSMVIIAAIIGSSADIGWEVLNQMRKARFGESLIAGLVIALFAMVLDRISMGFSNRSRAIARQHAALTVRAAPWVLALAVVVLCSVFAPQLTWLSVWPEQWEFYPADAINNALKYVTAEYSSLMKTIKNSALFYFLLPIRIGFSKAISPFSWGFALEPWMMHAYAAAAAVIALLGAWRFSWRFSVGVVIATTLLWYGMTGLPWVVFILVVSTIAWQVADWRVGLLSLFAWLFMVVTGIWEQAMLSVAMCLAAVMVCLLLGGMIGIWASRSDRVSAFIRPINDTLQSMPLFVILIPFLMFFQIGEFTSFLAIIAYAIVPCIRYTEHGLRGVPESTVEAATSMGCTPRQLLWNVKLPLALPQIMLGLNQTVMFALAMLVITALVGSKGLGQSVYIALSNSDAGQGLVAGFGMAFIAIVTDRVLQGWSLRRQRELGLVS